MDKILLIDGLNFVWRANVSFGKKKHTLCSGPNDESGHPIICKGYYCERPLEHYHCTCGAEWIYEEECCSILRYNIVYNFFRNLRATVEHFSPDKIFFCLEGKDNFRYKLFSEYKANRIVKTGTDKSKTQEDFHRQKRIILDLISCLPITKVKADGYECDDVIATLSENLKEEAVTILSTDSDFVQLLQKGYPNLKIFHPGNKEYLTPPDYHYLTWKCLSGDKKTDNIPGLVGPKTAEKLATNIKEFTAFLSSEEHRSNYSLNKQLIELQIVSEDQLQFTDFEINFEKIKDAFEHMDFKTMLADTYWHRFKETFSNLR